MKKSSAALLIAILSCSSGPRLPSGPPRPDTIIEVRGAVKGGPFRLAKADLDALPRGKVEGTDPVTGRTATWEGPQLSALAYGRVELSKGADTAVIRTSDRRAIPIPITIIRTYRPVLADRADGVVLPHRVVAWPNGAQVGLPTDPRARLWWARGIQVIEVVNSFTTYGRALAVPDGAPEGARPGADLFGALCIACHRMRKAGGEAGPDLTRVADRITPDAFYAMLTKHPGWTEATAESRTDGGTHQLWAFLRSVAAVESGAAEAPEQPTEKERDDRRRYPGS